MHLANLAQIFCSTLVLSFFSVSGFAAGQDCTFAPREKLGELFIKMSSDVIGIASCHDRFPDTSAIVVGRFKKLDLPSFKEFVRAQARIADGTAESSSVFWESKQPIEKRQMIVKTVSPATPSRPHADVMSHYSFVSKTKDGSYLVFIHTARDVEATKMKRSLEAINRKLSSPQFAALIP